MSKSKKAPKPLPAATLAVIRRLNERAEKTGRTRADLSRLTGIASPHVTTALGGKKGLSVEALTQYSDALGLHVLSEDVAGLPLVGTVGAGPGEDEPASAGDYLHVHELFATANGAYRVCGLSMRDAGILPGDYLAVRRCEDADAGEIVVAWVRDHGMVVKRLRADADGRKYLWSEDGTGTPLVLAGEDQIRGVLVGVVRTYRKEESSAGGKGKGGKPPAAARGRKK